MDDYIYIGELSERHKKALELFVGKFKKGAVEHGDLQEGRIWTKDELEETVDLIFYLLFDLMNKE